MVDQDSFAAELPQKSNQIPAMLALSEEFAALALGSIQVPKSSPLDRLSGEVVGMRREFCSYLWLRGGPLFRHFLASVPAVLEELSRVGCALLAQCSKQPSLRHFYWDIDAFDGSFGRALSHFSAGQIVSLTNTPNAGNVPYFNAQVGDLPSRLICCPFYEVDEANIISELGAFGLEAGQGFDFALEMAAFQFYDQDRHNQMARVCSSIAANSLAFFLEKVNHTNKAEYWRRERIKDTHFKPLYFSADEIAWKQRQMLERMSVGQVCLDHLTAAVKNQFSHANSIWNSGNFYLLASSNSADRLTAFTGDLGALTIDDIFVDLGGIGAVS